MTERKVDKTLRLGPKRIKPINEHGQNVLRVRQELKAHYIERMGGQCARCGYNEFVSGLEFHHLEDKGHSISHLFTSLAGCSDSTRIMRTARLEVELSKCVLLCRNCHGSLHASAWEIEDCIQAMPELETQTTHRPSELAYLPLFDNFN